MVRLALISPFVICTGIYAGAILAQDKALEAHNNIADHKTGKPKIVRLDKGERPPYHFFDTNIEDNPEFKLVYPKRLNLKFDRSMAAQVSSGNIKNHVEARQFSKYGNPGGRATTYGATTYFFDKNGTIIGRMEMQSKASVYFDRLGNPYSRVEKSTDSTSNIKDKKK